MKPSSAWRCCAVLACAVLLPVVPALLPAQASQSKPPGKPQIVDMGTYRVSTPPGGGWDVETDQKAGKVSFQKTKKGSLLGLVTNSDQGRNTCVSVQPIRLEFEEWRMTDEEAAADIIKTYALGAETWSEKGTTTLGGKKLYSLQFQRTVAVPRESGILEDCMVYLYFPPDFKKSRVTYEFQSIFTRADSGLKLYKNPGLDPVHAVIDSLEIVDPLEAVPGPEGELLRAAAAGDLEAARQAVEKGAKADAAVPKMTALSAGALYGHRSIVEFLLGKGADVNGADMEGGRTPLHQALIGGEPEIAEMLIQAGAQVDLRTLKGFSPMMYAAAIGHSGLVSLLSERGADVNAKSNDGETALIIAARAGSKEIAQLLAAKGADLNAQKNNGWSALLYAVVFEYADVARWLLESGADVNLKNKRGQTALMSLASRGDLEMVRALIEKGADVNAKQTDGGWTPLLDALTNEKYHIALALIEAGADVNAKLEYGTTALMIAAGKAPADVIKILLGKGAEVDARNEKKQTALKIATKNKRADIVALLKAAGAKG